MQFAIRMPQPGDVLYGMSTRGDYRETFRRHAASVIYAERTAVQGRDPGGVRMSVDTRLPETGGGAVVGAPFRRARRRRGLLATWVPPLVTLMIVFGAWYI